MSEENKALIRLYIQAVDDADGDYSVVEQFLAPDFVTHNPIPGFTTDREGVKKSSEMFFSATPDGHHAIKMQIAEGDLVASLIVGYGTQTGELLGVPPTGKEVEAEGIAIHRVNDGKIVEHWSVTDVAGLLVQLGALPPPGA